MNTDVLIIVCIAGGVCGVALLIALALLLRRCCCTEDAAKKRRMQRRYRPVDTAAAAEAGEAAADDAEDTSATMTALFFLRSHTELALGPQLRSIGRRREKHFFSLQLQQQTQSKAGEEQRVLTLTRRAAAGGAEGAAAVARVGGVVAACAHPHVSCPLLAEAVSATDVVAVVRPWCRRGSLRDFVHQSAPAQPYARKYSNMFCLGERHIARFGRQVLEALLCLRQLGIPGCHAHAGNVLLLSTTTAALAEWELALLGLVPRHIAVIRALALRRVEPEVACFACILFEMAAGFELESVEAADLVLSPASQCPLRVRKVLESILHPWSAAPPSVEDLLRLDFFAEVELPQVIPRRRVEVQPAEQRAIQAARDMMAALYGATSPTAGTPTAVPSLSATTTLPPQHSPSRRQQSQQSLPRKKSKRSMAASKPAPPQIEFASLSQMYYSPSAPVPTIAQPAAQQTEAQATPSSSSSPQRQASTTTPAPAPAPAPAPPPPPPPPTASKKSPPTMSHSAALLEGAPTAPAAPATTERRSLLDSICSFDANKLRKVK